MKQWLIPCGCVVAVVLIVLLVLWGNNRKNTSKQNEEKVTEEGTETVTPSETLGATPTLTEAQETTPSPTPAETPNPSLTEKPTPELSATPEPTRTKAPTKAPVGTPAQTPTKVPTKAPTSLPTKAPTKAPTPVSTQAPTKVPTPVPTQEPTSVPTSVPTQKPTPIPDPVVNPGEKVTQYSGRLYGAPNKMDYSLRLIAYNRTETSVMIRIEMTFIEYPGAVHPFTHHLYWNNFDAIVFVYSQWAEPVDHSRIIQAGAKKFKFACTPETTSISIPAHFYTTDANHNPNPAEGLDLYWDLVAQLPEYVP
ncbi:MAG: hypothetical protein J5795_04380 [Lachnospiraceae bacterium]|nr:hypothetical protein [Lachnospiraceae bacterium]